MPNLTRASQELFRRSRDECFESLAALAAHCRRQQETSRDVWAPPDTLGTKPLDMDRLMLTAGNDGAYELNDWSFSQLCRLAGVGKETVNRLSPDTASRVFAETLPQGNKPLQLFTDGSSLGEGFEARHAPPASKPPDWMARQDSVFESRLFSTGFGDNPRAVYTMGALRYLG